MNELDEFEWWKMSSATIQGDVGEVIVANSLRNERGTYLVRNIYLPYNDITTEIDMVWLTPKGIFCIECKNYNGEIDVDLYSNFWTVRYNSLHTERLFSPIKQNIRHTSCLAEILEGYDIDITPIVVFTDKAKLPNCSSDNGVFNVSDFVNWYRSQNTCNKYNSKVLESIYIILNKYSDISDIAKLKHTASLGRKG